MRSGAVRSHGGPTGNTGEHFLAPAPEGLSARRVEEWLELPAGAWHRRRLFALRVRSTAFADLGLREGDFLIVEPGERERPGQIVVSRGPEGLRPHRIDRPVLRLTPSDSPELPFQTPPSSRRGRTVGTVIGVVRPTGTGALRPARRRRALRSDRDGASRADSTAVTGAGPAPSASQNFVEDRERLAARLEDWAAWVASQASEREADDAAVLRWRRLEARLATLVRCLGVARNQRLGDALLAEAHCVARSIERERSRCEGAACPPQAL